MTNITLITRRSPLAMWQTETVRDRLLQASPSLSITIAGHSTGGDREQSIALQDIGGKNLFAHDLQTQIKTGACAVHSLKDLSVNPKPGLTLAATLPRGPVPDALVSNGTPLDALPPGANIGTASPRRRSQLLAVRPDINCKLIRGNVGTRLAKLDSGEFDAIILAACGLERLGLSDRVTELLDPDIFVPAIGQAVVCVESLSDDHTLQALLKTIHCEETFLCIQAERAFNQYLGGDCFSAIAAHAQIDNGQLFMRSYVGSLDGQVQLRGEMSGNDPQNLGLALGKELEAQGARDLLNQE